MRRAVILAAVLCLTAVAVPAQTQYLVSPQGLETWEGGANNNFPFTTSLFSYQQIHDDLVGRPRLISELAFRRDGKLTSAVAARSYTVTLRLSSTTLTADQAQSTFAANHGPDLTQVLTSQVINWPAETTPALPPAPFSFVIPFASQPFLYKNTPGLCWEVRVHAAATSGGAHDAVSTASPYERFGLGCTAAGQPTGAYLMAYPTISVATQSWNFTCTGRYFGKAQPAFWLLGDSDTQFAGVPLPLPLGPLGFPGCTLYTSILLSIAGTTDANGTLSITGVSVPLDPALKGITFFSQGLSTDTGPVPLVFSDGCKAMFQYPASARIYASGNDQATTGTVGYPYGIVTRFTN